MANKTGVRWWQLDVEGSHSAMSKWIVPGLLIFCFAVLIGELQSSNFARASSFFGFICMFSAYAVGPRCWGVIEAAEGSNSQKALTLISMFGFILGISGFIAHYTRV